MTTAATWPTRRSPQRVGFLRQLGVDTGYILLGFPLAIASFTVIVTGLSAGLGTLVIVVGLPDPGRHAAASLASSPISSDCAFLPCCTGRAPGRHTGRPNAGDGVGSGSSRRSPRPSPGSTWRTASCISRSRWPLSASWSRWWATAIGGTLTVAWDWSIPRGPDNTSLAQLIGLGDSAFARIGLQTAIGLVCLVTLPGRGARLRADLGRLQPRCC